MLDTYFNWSALDGLALLDLILEVCSKLWNAIAG